MVYPATRMRRLRRTEAMRSLVRETHLRPSQLIYPLFICPGEGIRKPIGSMPGVHNLSIDEALKEAATCAQLGIGGLLLFGLPEAKDDLGSGAYADDGIVQQALRVFKQDRALDPLVLIADVCLCEYTSHGHCGVLVHERGEVHVHNDQSLPLLARAAAMRSALDAAGHHDTPILSYAAKFASAFYGPFREAADSAPQLGDRRGYQMDAANAREAMREIEGDVAEGADMLLMKPAGPYLDIIRAARDRFDLPMGAYQVSGEYSMLHAAFERGWLDRDRAMLESLLGIRRAGADFIVTYFAKDAAKLLG